MTKRIWFTALALGIPLLVLAGLEGGLRWSGVGAGEHAVFTTVPGHPDYQVLNAAYLERYFNGSFKPDVAYNPFRKAKQAGTFRVMVLGGSSVAGFPYRFYLGFPAHLQQRLEAEAAGQRIEVVNLGVTAANSYTLWDLKDAVAAQAPDAVLIYAGHNEYYGAFGAGSSVNALGNRIWLKRFILRLKRLVLYRSLERLWHRLAPRPADDRSLMAQMIRNAGITLDSDAYRDGVAQFEANMRAVLETFRAAGIPVYMGTLVANLKDQPPLSRDPEALNDYEQGQRLLVGGDTVQARVAFRSAKDKDAIRFRAPEALNDVIQAFAREGLLTPVDLAPVARSYSASGVEDEWFFADHLHPNTIGYYLIGETYAEALRDHPALRRRPPVRMFSGEAALPDTLDWRTRTIQLDRQLADPFERLFGHLQVFSINAGYPFSEASPEQERLLLRQTLGRVRSSLNYLDQLTYRTLVNELTPADAISLALPVARARGDTLYALQLYRSALYWEPFDEALRLEAMDFATAAARAGRAYVPTAENLLFRVVNLHRDVAALATLADLRMRRGAVDEAAALLSLAESLNPDAEVVRRVRIRLVALQNEDPGA